MCLTGIPAGILFLRSILAIGSSHKGTLVVIKVSSGFSVLQHHVGPEES